MSRIDPKVERAWIKEAVRRREELLSGQVEGIPAEEVYAKLGAGLRR